MSSSQKLPLAAVAAFSYLQMKRTSINIASPFKLTNRTQKQIEKKRKGKRKMKVRQGKGGKLLKWQSVCVYSSKGEIRQMSVF